MRSLEHRTVNKYRNLKAAATAQSPNSCNHRVVAAAAAEDEKAALEICRENGNPLSAPVGIHNSSLSQS